MIGAGPEIRVSRMLKRSQNRKFFSRESYKMCEFVLMPGVLKYFDISAGNRGKEKGRIPLSNMKIIEKVRDGDLDGKKNVFQLTYVKDDDKSNHVLIYILSNSTKEVEDWLNLLRLHCRDSNASFYPRYHPGVWQKPGRLSCCDAINRRSCGCQETSCIIPTELPNAIATTNNQIHSLLAITNVNNTPTSPVIVNNDMNPLSSSSNKKTISSSISISNNGPTDNNIIVSSTTPNPAVPILSLSSTNANGDTKIAIGRKHLSQKNNRMPTTQTFEGNNGNDGVEHNTVIAIHNYNPVRPNQLALLKGEKYIVIDKSNSQWWYVRNMAGTAGYVPTNYVQKPDSLTTFDWYYKDLTRQQAEAILLEESREGCFLVRDSVSKRDTFTLSVTSKDPDNPGKLKVHHYHIHRSRTPTLPNSASGTGTGTGAAGVGVGIIGTAGGAVPITTTGSTGSGDSHRGSSRSVYYLSEKHVFPTISDVIHYHKHNSGGLVVRLRSPPMKDRDSPATAGMGLDEFELDPTELQIEPEIIGKGQFGVVKRGTFHGIPVAIKQMVDGAMNEDDFVEEAKNMKFLNHPNLVQLFGVVLRRRPIMIITEYMEYGSLRDFLRANHPSIAHRSVYLADMCAQVAYGMAYLEKEQFVHRDLAARNCLVKSVHGSSSVRVKVADFGMTRFLLDNVYEPSTGTKFPVRWASPEVFQSLFTSKADVWSFAVLMWEVFTCCLENPYQGKDNAQVYQYIVGGGRLFKPAMCPQRLYVLMLECWQHDPQKRPTFQYICQIFFSFLDQHAENS